MTLYRKCPPNKLLIVYGFGAKVLPGMSRGYRMVQGWSDGDGHVETGVHGDWCPRRLLSMETGVHGGCCPLRLLPIENSIDGGCCPWRLVSMHAGVHGD